jgi:hypothetical protein
MLIADCWLQRTHSTHSTLYFSTRILSHPSWPPPTVVCAQVTADALAALRAEQAALARVLQHGSSRSKAPPTINNEQQPSTTWSSAVPPCDPWVDIPTSRMPVTPQNGATRGE